MRFFFRMKIFSHKMAQQQWASVDYRKNMSLVGAAQIKGHKEIVAIGTYADDGKGRAEVAFVVREDQQGTGIGTHLLIQLENIAKENGFKGFTATVLKENAAMMHVFKKRYPHMKVTSTGGNENQVIMDFQTVSD